MIDIKQETTCCLCGTTLIYGIFEVSQISSKPKTQNICFVCVDTMYHVMERLLVLQNQWKMDLDSEQCDLNYQKRTNNLVITYTIKTTKER